MNGDSHVTANEVTSAQGAEPEDIAVELDYAGRSADVEREFTGEEDIKEPFDPEKIDVTTRNPTVDLLLSRMRRGSLDVDPEFQRLAGIWTPDRQSRLIESMLLRIPLPTFYAAERDEDTWMIVDGIQRLTTIARFIQPDSIGSDPLVLRDMEYLKYEGKIFDQLPGRLQTRLLETEVVVHLIRRGTPESVMFNIFARINTGGMPLARQELRHALIPGPARGLLRDLAESEAFQRATAGSVSPSRMDDREMVLRFIAFRLTPPENYLRQDFDEFLRDAMRRVNGLDRAQMSELVEDFARSMRAALEIFGAHAFRKRYPGQQRRNPVNKALFETISVNLAKRADHEIQELTERQESVQERFSATMASSSEFVESISVGTGDIAKVRQRFAQIDAIFRDVLGD